MTATDRPRLNKKTERNLTRIQAHDNAAAARADLVSTLSALEDKLNVPKQFKIKTAEAKVRLRRFADEQPVVAIGVAVAAVAAVGVTVWLVVRANLDR
ncbi:DUF3618 domain-containing protein [Agromyces albus]|uniref:DUF3618 domain-containing protein n=1 Tax=Agromyces albus TaxID=205332 RepID=UPI0027818DB5|nr:DUF3618 domain-containing protein [Agromyces albus]MDQ0577518.1 ElaB/YqjD/DUF883 family membrane-anchored ribosome-binding protein [Agromyces albus]